MCLYCRNKFVMYGCVFSLLEKKKFQSIPILETKLAFLRVTLASISQIHHACGGGTEKQ